MSGISDEISRWPRDLLSAIAETSHFKNVTVLRVTDSTQDAARRLDAQPGDIIVAGRQTAGRGRLGRTWSDTADEGIACTFVVKPCGAERLAAAAATGSAIAVESLAGMSVSIKWPNDLYVRSRKLGGILIEQSSEAAFIGIGINVGQTAFEGELSHRAISMAMLGVSVDRTQVMSALIRSLDMALGQSESWLASAFDDRNYLRGRVVKVASGGIEHRGRAVRIDPIRGLELATDSGPVTLAGSTATILDDGGLMGGYDLVDQKSE
jgi:BirA family transcriptional regulator, biotin operon repressor / biotin---[acetyl-CoA-carboxylase] ligase